MTALGPYSESTLPEPQTCYLYAGTLAKCNGLLKTIKNKFPAYYELIVKTKLEAFYNDNTIDYTVFIPAYIPINIDKYGAYTILKETTCRGKLLPDALMSSCSMLLTSLSEANDLLIMNNNGIMYVNGYEVLYSMSREKCALYLVNGPIVPANPIY